MKLLFSLISCALLGTANSEDQVIDKESLIEYGVEQTVNLLHCLATATSSVRLAMATSSVDRNAFERLKKDLTAVYPDAKEPTASCENFSFLQLCNYDIKALRNLAESWTEYSAGDHILPLAIKQYRVLKLSSSELPEQQWNASPWRRFLRAALDVNQHSNQDVNQDVNKNFSVWQTQRQEIKETWSTGLLSIGFAELGIEEDIPALARVDIGVPPEQHINYAVQETMDLLNCLDTATSAGEERRTIVRAKETLSDLKDLYFDIKPEKTCEKFKLKVTDMVDQKIEILCSLGKSWLSDKAEYEFASFVLKHNDLLKPAFAALKEINLYRQEGSNDGALGLLVAAFNLDKDDPSIRESQIKKIQEKWLEISKSLIMKPVSSGTGPSRGLRLEAKRKTRGRGKNTRRQATRRQKGKGKVNGWHNKRSKRAFPEPSV